MDARRSLPPWKTAVYAAVVCAGFFATLEGALWLLGVEPRIGREDPLRGFSGLVTVFERHGDVYKTRFTEPLRVFNDQTFAVEKPANGLRIFTLGGSSAYGYPWDAGASFTGILGDLLAAAHPDRVVEAVNAAGVSYAMHRLRFVAREIEGYEPDLVLVFSGHNEFIEPDFFAEMKQRTAAVNRLVALLSHSRLYSGMQTLASRSEAPDRARQARFDLFVRRNETTVYTEEAKSAVVDSFRQGLGEIVRGARAAGARVVLMTVPANLRDWQPQRSIVGEDLSEAARAEWSARLVAGSSRLAQGRRAEAVVELEAARDIAPSHAQTHYLLGRAYDGLGRWDAARQAYARACDLDASPVRRVSGTNQAVREIARQEGVLLVDVERAFEQRSEHGLVGFGLIEDYVHPTLEGHQLIAWELWKELAEAGWLGEGALPQRAVFERVVANRREPEAEHNAVWLFNQAAVLRHAGHLEQAREKYRRALEISPGFAPPYLGLGSVLQAEGRYAEALPYYRRALELGLDTADVHDSLGMTLHALGRDREAVIEVRRATQLDPTHALALNNLAWLLLIAADPDLRDSTESLRLASEAARLTEHRDFRVLDTLAAAQAEAGQFGDAVRTATRALALAGSSSPAARREIRLRLEAYRAGKSFR